MDKPRRDFLRICAIATATAASTPSPAWATRIRVLGDVGDQDRPIAVGQSNPDFRRFISSVRIGHARRLEFPAGNRQGAALLFEARVLHSAIL